jgi:hypothetical protein
MSADLQPSPPTRPPMNVYTAMLAISFVAMCIACVIMALELFTRGLPLRP